MSDTIKKGQEHELVVETPETKTQVYSLEQLKELKQMWQQTKVNAQANIDYYSSLIAEAKTLGVLSLEELKAKNEAEELKTNP